jgi:acetolactate synthase-1/2/3 large subunit
MSMRINGAEIIIRSLERLGIDTITGIPGGSNLPIYDALRRSGIRHILARHEQGAGFIAQGMARSTGRTAVCFATSGPGVMNLLTAIADAKLDSVPIVAITGQVPSSMIGTDAFQEVNTYGMTMNITKHNYMVLSPEELLTVIPEAFSLARSGRPGPVVIDVPKDIQMKEIEIDEWPETAPPRDDTFIDESVLLTIAARLESSRRPVIYAGGGIIHACASHELLCLARKCSIPVALTLMGLGAFPPDDPLYLGMLGMHGARYTNYVLEEADLLLALGVRFDDRAVGNAMEFCPGADIIHIDVDDSEINKIRQSNISIRGDVKTSLSRILPMLHGNSRSEWIYRVNELKGLYGFPRPKTADPFHPLNLIRNIAAAARDDAIITTDVGQH